MSRTSHNYCREGTERSTTARNAPKGAGLGIEREGKGGEDTAANERGWDRTYPISPTTKKGREKREIFHRCQGVETRFVSENKDSGAD